VTHANERAVGLTWKYLHDIELVSDYLEDALSAFGAFLRGL